MPVFSKHKPRQHGRYTHMQTIEATSHLTVPFSSFARWASAGGEVNFPLPISSLPPPHPGARSPRSPRSPRAPRTLVAPPPSPRGLVRSNSLDALRGLTSLPPFSHLLCFLLLLLLSYCFTS